jgi:hypothetical protein
MLEFPKQISMFRVLLHELQFGRRVVAAPNSGDRRVFHIPIQYSGDCSYG